MARKKAKRLEKDGRYKDAPRFQVIYGYENDFKNKFKKNTKRMVEEVSALAMKMVSKKSK